MNGGIDRLVAEMKAILEVELRNGFNGKWAESPIERLFLLALKYITRLDRASLMYVHAIYEAPLPVFPNGVPLYEIVISPQCELCGYRVDFLISVSDAQGRTHSAVVECDGHDFHERTKEQAQRDRKRDRTLQAAGYRVFRFTGSEIYRDPIAPAREILAWVDSVWFPGGAE